MCATLLAAGLSAGFVLIRGVADHAPVTVLLFYAPGVLVAALALLLLTSSPVIPRIAFWVLLLLGLSSIYVIFRPLPPTISHASKSTHAFYALVLLFPCFVALWSAKRRGTPNV
jgi:hypothetical protein